MNLTRNLKKNYLKELEWDNDLSNAAEDYYKINGSSNLNDYKNEMGKLIRDSYDQYTLTDTIIYSGKPLINNIIIQTFMNSANAKILLSENINHIGVFAAPIRKNMILVIINLSKFN